MRTLPVPQRAERSGPPAAALVLTSSVSGQCGSALATKLIGQVGPAGALTMRLVFAAVALAVIARPWRMGIRPLRRVLRPSRRADLAVVVLFGLVLAGMNLSFYESIARIPLGVAVTVEFIGPLTIALLGSRRWTDGLWALLAGGGVLLLASGSIFGAVHHLDVAGVGFAVLAGCFWASYILINRETGRRFRGTTGLAGAMAVGAILVAPIAALRAGADLLHPAILGVGVVVAVLTSVVPYSCEIAALRRATPRAFGILLSMAPAFAALAGFAILGQRLSGFEVGALVLVIAANVGSSSLGNRTGGVRMDTQGGVPGAVVDAVPATPGDAVPATLGDGPAGAPGAHGQARHGVVCHPGAPQNGLEGAGAHGGG